MHGLMEAKKNYQNDENLRFPTQKSQETKRNTRSKRGITRNFSFMRDYLDRVTKADQCSQYVDDIGRAANHVTQLMRNIRAVFECISKAGLKLTTVNRKTPLWSN